MNLDASSQVAFGDGDALRQFMIDHRFVHQQSAGAIVVKTGINIGSFGVSSQSAEEQWIALMQEGERQRTPTALNDWLQYHSDIHQAEYAALGQAQLAILDLSNVDFSQAGQFYDWMYAHQVIHDQVQQLLGLT